VHSVWQFQHECIEKLPGEVFSQSVLVVWLAPGLLEILRYELLSSLRFSTSAFSVLISLALCHASDL